MELIQPETKNISSVQFSIMSPDEIRSRSVVEITKYETYDKDTPVVKGLFDIRMGSTEMGKICQTCGQKNIDCPGHFGHLELAKPVYHFHLIDQVPKILKCVCFNCSKLLINKTDVIGLETLKSTKVYCKREVIICQGAFGTPHLLMLSGIGPADHLRNIGSNVSHDLPGVGQNLQDHATVSISWECLKEFEAHKIDLSLIHI